MLSQIEWYHSKCPGVKSLTVMPQERFINFLRRYVILLKTMTLLNDQIYLRAEASFSYFLIVKNQAENSVQRSKFEDYVSFLHWLRAIFLLFLATSTVHGAESVAARIPVI